MRSFIVLFSIVLLFGCGGQSKEELVQEGNSLKDSGNFRGAVVLYKNALEKDANYLDARMGLAGAYFESGNFANAEKEYQKVLLQNPNASDLLLKLAAIYIQQRQPEKALLELDKFHSDNHETSESLVLYGRAHGASGDLGSAENLFNKALSLDSQAIDPRYNLAKVYLQKNNLDRATIYLEEILKIKADEVEAYYLLANIATRQGQRDSAVDYYESLLGIDPNQLQALYMLGVLQMDLGDLDAAKGTASQLKSRFSDRPEGLRLEGLLLYRQGEFENAKIVLENAVGQEQHLLSYFFLGLTYYALEQYELALNQFQKALDLNPDFERSRVLVAMTLLKQKRLEDAVTEIQKVLRKNTQNAYAHNILGSAYLAQGKYDQGMAELELATDIDPNLADAHMKRGLFHLTKGEGAQGEADLVKAVDAAPEVLNSRLMLVTYYLRQKNYSSAIETITDGLNGSATDALLNNYLAAAYFSQNKPEKALEALNQAKQANPDYLTPYFNSAGYYTSKSEYQKAIGEYEAVLEKDATNLRALFGLIAVYNVQGDQDAVDATFKKIEATQTERGFVSTAQYVLREKGPAEALTVVDRGLGLHAKSAPLLELKGTLHMQLKQVAEAESALTQLSGVAPERGNSLLVRVYLSSGQTAKAESLINDLLTTESSKDYPYLLASGLYRSQAKNESAVKVLQDGVGKVANPVRLQMQLGRNFEQMKQTEKAAQLYQRIISDHQEFAPAYTALGFIKERDGDKGAAKNLYEDALSRDKKNITALNNLAYLLADNFGEDKKALNYAMSAYRLQPNDPRIMDTLGYILVKNDRADDAVNLLEKAHKLLPNIDEVTYHLAMAKSAVGQKEEARELLKGIVNSQSEFAREANALLKKL